MQDSLISQGLDLMMFGMGSVLAFLTVLMLAILAMTGIIRRWLPEAEPAPAIDQEPAPPEQAVDARIVRVIQAAIQQHRAKRNG